MRVFGINKTDKPYRLIEDQDVSHSARSRRVVRIEIPNAETMDSRAIADVVATAAKHALRKHRGVDVVMVFAYRPGTDPHGQASAGSCVLARDGKGWATDEPTPPGACDVTIPQWNAALGVPVSATVVRVAV